MVAQPEDYKTHWTTIDGRSSSLPLCSGFFHTKSCLPLLPVKEREKHTDVFQNSTFRPYLGMTSPGCPKTLRPFRCVSAFPTFETTSRSTMPSSSRKLASAFSSAVFPNIRIHVTLLRSHKRSEQTAIAVFFPAFPMLKLLYHTNTLSSLSRKDAWFLSCPPKSTRICVMTSASCLKRNTKLRCASAVLIFKDIGWLQNVFSSKDLVFMLPCHFSCRLFQTASWGTYGCAIQKDSLMIDGGFPLQFVLSNEERVSECKCSFLWPFPDQRSLLLHLCVPLGGPLRDFYNCSKQPEPCSMELKIQLYHFTCVQSLDILPAY